MIRRLLVIFGLLTYLLVPSSALAINPIKDACNAGSNSASICSHTDTSNNIYGPNGVLSKVINLISVVIGIVAVFAIIVAGMMFVVSGGDPAKVSKAKDTILYVLIGVAVVAIAQIVEHFVIYHLGKATGK